MMKKEITLLIVVCLLLPLLSADLIPLGKREIKINNTLTNIEDFPGYLFLSGPSDKNFEDSISSCQFIEPIFHGKIGRHYKFCKISI